MHLLRSPRGQICMKFGTGCHIVDIVDIVRRLLGHRQPRLRIRVVMD